MWIEKIKRIILGICLKTIDRLNMQDMEQDDVKAGTVYWCKMPLSDKDINEIPPGHRIRPYVILSIEQNKITGLACSSQYFKKVGKEKQFYINKADYRLSKSSYVDLKHVYEIPISNIYDYYYTLSKDHFTQIKNGIANKDMQREKLDIGIGSVVIKKEQYYYICDYNTAIYYAYRMYPMDVCKKVIASAVIACNKILYRLDFSNRVKIDIEQVKKAMQLTMKSHNLLMSKKPPKKKAAKKETCIPYDLKYELGQKFLIPNEKHAFIYLFHRSNTMYGTFDVMEEGGYIFRKLKAYDYVKQAICTKDKLLEVFDKIHANDEMMVILRQIRKNIK
ncbi:MAG: hypothetical protein ACLSUR_15095 [Coprobacillus cateniformis]